MRRIRAMLAFAILWAAAWGLVGFVLGLVTWLRFAAERDPASGLLMWGIASAIPYAIQGAICGFGFAVLLAGVERDRTIGDLSVRRTALWGAMAGAGFVLLYGVANGLAELPHLLQLFTYAAVFGGLGAFSAGASLVAARRGRLAPPAEIPQLPAL